MEIRRVDGRFYRRNADFQSLVQNLVFPDQIGIFKPHASLFFLGDLNYRLSILHPSRSTTKLSISPNEETSPEVLLLIEPLKENILNFLETRKFTNLDPHDQLPLSPFGIGSQLTFSPTYTTTRTPSWTDWILYLPETIVTEDYKSTTCATFSDHQAVSVSAVLHAEDFETEEGITPWEINPSWRERRALTEKLAYVFSIMEFITETKAGIIVLGFILCRIALYLYTSQLDLR
jgi:hypothetical protein